MPYIKHDYRPIVFNKEDATYNKNAISCAGDLNYVLSMFYLSDRYKDMSHGERVNYTYTACKYAHHNIGTNKYSSKNYQSHNDIIGALMGSLKEFQRRFAENHFDPASVEELVFDVVDKWYDGETAPYEDIKIKENGDIV